MTPEDFNVSISLTLEVILDIGPEHSNTHIVKFLALKGELLHGHQQTCMHTSTVFKIANSILKKILFNGYINIQ